MLASIAAISIIAGSVWYIAQSVPMLEKKFRIKSNLKLWHIATAALSVAIFLNAATPVHAIFLSGLETFVNTIVTDSAAASGGEAIDATVVTLVFNLFRLAFVLLVVAAALYAYNQAQQGNDWRPIVTQVAIAIAIVIAIDILTALFVKTA